MYFSNHQVACASEIYGALWEDIERLNRKRAETEPPVPPPIRRPNYSSFARYFHWFLILGLIERTGRHEPGLYDFLQEKVFYRLTPEGRAESVAWADPIRATHPEWR